MSDLLPVGGAYNQDQPPSAGFAAKFPGDQRGAALPGERFSGIARTVSKTPEPRSLVLFPGVTGTVVSPPVNRANEQGTWGEFFNSPASKIPIWAWLAAGILFVVLGKKGR